MLLFVLEEITLRMFAFIVENDVVNIAVMDESNPIAERWIAGLLSNPTFVNADNYPFLHFDCLYDGTTFYPPGDTAKANPYIPVPKDPVNKAIKFAGLVANEEVFGMISFEPDSYTDAMLEMLSVAMTSNPQIVEFADGTDAQVGYVWNGTNFHKPTVTA